MGLREGDLKDMVYDIFEIDSYKSKMGSDEEIVTLSFSVNDKLAAEDLSSFFEKGYSFILDADATKGEQSDGTFKVFVELERNKDATQNIMELADGLKKLAELDRVKFRYYKNFKSHELTDENLSENLPLDPENYGIKVNESNLENYKNFFNKSFVENVEMWDDIVKIEKKYADAVFFKFLDIGKSEEVLDNINESLDVDGFAEVIFLSKYIGDYNITKYGTKITFENQDKTLVLERIQT
jgi:hypothetical protein